MKIPHVGFKALVIADLKKVPESVLPESQRETALTGIMTLLGGPGRHFETDFKSEQGFFSQVDEARLDKWKPEADYFIAVDRKHRVISIANGVGESKNFQKRANSAIVQYLWQNKPANSEASGGKSGKAEEPEDVLSVVHSIQFLSNGVAGQQLPVEHGGQPCLQVYDDKDFSAVFNLKTGESVEFHPGEKTDWL